MKCTEIQTQSKASPKQAKGVLSNKHYSGMAALLFNLFEIAKPAINSLNERDKDLLRNQDESALDTLHDTLKTHGQLLTFVPDGEVSSLQTAYTLSTLSEASNELFSIYREI